MSQTPSHSDTPTTPENVQSPSTPETGEAGITTSPKTPSSEAIRSGPPGQSPTFEDAGRPRSKSSTFQRVVLPTGAIIIAIGVISFLVQYMPNWRTAPPKKQTPDRVAPLKFANQRGPVAFAVWGPTQEDAQYSLECEQGEQYSYDYLFHNTSGGDAEIILNKMQCGCSSLKASILPKEKATEYFRDRQNKGEWLGKPDDSLEWTEFAKGKGKKGVVIPKGQSGLVRLGWEARGGIGSSPNLRADLWMRSADDQTGTTHPVSLFAKAVIVAPVRFDPPIVKFGMLAPNETVHRTLYSWTSTRDSLKLSIDTTKAAKEPCIECKITPIKDDQFAKLSKTITGQEWGTRIKAAYRIDLTVAESKIQKLPGGKTDVDQLTMGRVWKKLPLQAVADEIEVKDTIPYLSGWVDSEIQIGSPGSQTTSKVNQQSIKLGTYSAREPKTIKYKLFGERNIELTLDRTEEAGYIKAELGKAVLEGKSKYWWLTITTQKTPYTGSFSDKAAIVLRRQHPSKPVREIRIPISGTVLE